MPKMTLQEAQTLYAEMESVIVGTDVFHHRPMTLQVCIEGNGRNGAVVYVDEPGIDGQCLARVYLDAEGLAKLRRILGA